MKIEYKDNFLKLKQNRTFNPRFEFGWVFETGRELLRGRGVGFRGSKEGGGVKGGFGSIPDCSLISHSQHISILRVHTSNLGFVTLN